MRHSDVPCSSQRVTVRCVIPLAFLPWTRSGYWKVVALAFATATLSAGICIYGDFRVSAGYFVCWTPSSFPRERSSCESCAKNISENCLKRTWKFEPVDIIEAFGSNSFVTAELLPMRVPDDANKHHDHHDVKWQLLCKNIGRQFEIKHLQHATDFLRSSCRLLHVHASADDSLPTSNDSWIYSYTDFTWLLVAAGHDLLQILKKIVQDATQGQVMCIIIWVVASIYLYIAFLGSWFKLFGKGTSWKMRYL